jgi:polar amino acid transport system substrate-binding protein
MGAPGLRPIAALAALALAFAAALAGGCGPERSPESDLSRLEREGVARVGFANEAPFAYIEPGSGELTGEAPEIARVVLARMGVGRIEGVLTEFGSLIPGLQAGRFDLIAAGMYITPARCREIAFSLPTYSIGGAFLVRRGNPEDLHGYDDVLARDGARLGVMAGAVERGYALRVGIPTARLVTFPDPPSAVAGLAADRVDAFAATALTARDLLAKVEPGGIELARPFHDPVFDGRPARGYGAFGFRKQSRALREAFDRQLRDFIGSAEHLALVRTFGFGEAQLPGDATPATLCRP